MLKLVGNVVNIRLVGKDPAQMRTVANCEGVNVEIGASCPTPKAGRLVEFIVCPGTPWGGQNQFIAMDCSEVVSV